MILWVRRFRGLGLASLLLGGMVFGTVTTSVVTAGRAVAETAASIVVQGNRRVEADTIRSYFRTGRALDAATIDEALKSLYGTGLFQDVRINRAGGRLVVTVVENPVINRVAFEGNKKVKDEQLSGEVQSKARGTLSRPIVQADTQRIVEIYRRNGRFDVRVEPKVIELPNNRVDLVFEISEGAKTSVKKIRFVGNNAFGDQRLKDELKTSETFFEFLSFLQTSDIYDPDRIEADRDLLRRFYLKKGYPDVRIVAAVAEYDPARNGFTVTYTIEEGQRYRFGTVDVQSNVPAVDPQIVRSSLRVSRGSVYNAEAIEKSVENMSIEVARRGYPFASVRPRGDKDFATATVNVVFVIEEGPRVYIERINIRGNTRTRDYVIRREFDLAEGDAYNRALIDRAERRLKNLNYFKIVKITNEPGSAADRIVINVDVEEMPTGELSLAGGYSTADGFMAEVSVGERNLLGHGQYIKASIQYGQRARGFEFSFVEPFFLGYRLAAGFDVYAKHTLASNYYSYDNKILGTGFRVGFALSEEISLQMRYSIYRQEITLPSQFNNCSVTFTPAAGCYADGEASIAVRTELANGPVLVSMPGYSVAYNTLDNNKNPTSGTLIEFKQDFAGVGGDVSFVRTTTDARAYYEIFSDVVTIARLQGGHLGSWGGRNLRMLDHFQMGPNLVRGFAPAGLGPRDMTPGTSEDALGGTMFWGASLEAQAPFHFLPKEVGIKGAIFADAGSLWNYRGPVTFPTTGETLTLADSSSIRASVGAGVIWNSPFGPLRFDYAIPLKKEGYDRVQEFRFGGGTRF
jgi:outer membrane protein insertion porin family